MQIRRVLILDGYTDEPSGFGVPPYIDVYPRYIAGALWFANKSTIIHYYTVDQVRKDIHNFMRRVNEYDAIAVIAGAIVPGKYIGGKPISFNELREWMNLVIKPVKILVGSAAKWGIGNIGGTIAISPSRLAKYFDFLVKGDVEQFFYELATEGPEKVSPWTRLEKIELLDDIAVKGAKLVRQHPNHGYNLVAEIETYRGCPRHKSGGCSFCVTHLYGTPRERRPQGILREIEALHQEGVRHFRLGRQADITVYGSKELALEEWPRPNPDALEKLFYGIRSVAPYIKTLHIDNVNPGTLARYPKESREALKAIIKYHTPGDVAALGIETVDEKVVELNNLKVGFEGALNAIRLVFEVGGMRGYNGLPEMLAGINFVLGLIGETKHTYELNREFLEKVYNEGLLVRRINVRSVLVLPVTRMQKYGTVFLEKNRRYAKSFKKFVMDISAKFLKRMIPIGTILKYLYVEYYDSRHGLTFARQAGSYPILVEIPCRLHRPALIDVFVYAYSGRSLRGIPLPLNANTASYSVLAKLFGSRAAEVIGARPFRDNKEVFTRIPWGAGLLSVNGFTC